MSSNGAFVLPAGLRLSVEGDALSIHNEGDIHIEVAPGQPLHTLSSAQGDIVLSHSGGITLHAIHAPQGRVTLSGKIEVDSIVAREIVFYSGRLKASVVKGLESVELGGSRVEAHVVVAPLVNISGSVKGRATAISADNDLGAHQLKGGFSLLEFVELVPNGREILTSHQIEVPDEEEEDDDDDGFGEDISAELPPPAPEPEEDRHTSAPARAAVSAPEPVPAVQDSLGIDEIDDDDLDTGGNLPAIRADQLGLAPDDDDDDDGRPFGDAGGTDETPVIDDEEPPPQRPPEWEAAAATIRTSLEEIRAAYDSDVPPPVSELAALVHDGDLGELKSSINGIWSSLLKHHQRSKAYIPNTVTHMFQQIQMELRKI